MYPTYLGRRMAHIRVRKVPLEIEPEVLATSILEGTKEETEIGQASKTLQVNQWEFGLELFLLLSEKNFRKIPTQIELPEGKKLFVILKVRLPVCFFCFNRGRIKKNYSLKSEIEMRKDYGMGSDEESEEMSETEKEKNGDGGGGGEGKYSRSNREPKYQQKKR